MFCNGIVCCNILSPLCFVASLNNWKQSQQTSNKSRFLPFSDHSTFFGVFLFCSLLLFVSESFLKKEIISPCLADKGYQSCLKSMLGQINPGMRVCSFFKCDYCDLRADAGEQMMMHMERIYRLKTCGSRCLMKWSRPPSLLWKPAVRSRFYSTQHMLPLEKCGKNKTWRRFWPNWFLKPLSSDSVVWVGEPY